MLRKSTIELHEQVQRINPLSSDKALQCTRRLVLTNSALMRPSVACSLVDLVSRVSAFLFFPSEAAFGAASKLHSMATESETRLWFYKTLSVIRRGAAMNKSQAALYHQVCCRI
jgi:hypothetical protein